MHRGGPGDGGTGFVVGPALDTALYRVGPIYPAAFGGLLCLAAGFLQLHPAIRSAA